MAADTRNPTTDALETLGTIITAKEKRDAIHLGVEPAVAGMMLLPGNHVAWTDASKTHVVKVAPTSPDAIGIVDPFLCRPVMGNERFWLIVYPRQITSLRHVWEHPHFPASQETGSQG